MIASEVYKLECACGAQLEIPCTPPFRCGSCGTNLDIQWRPKEELAEIATEQEATA